MSQILKWLIARPILIVVGALALLWLIFNYQNLSTVYFIGKYLILFIAGLWLYPHAEKIAGKSARGAAKEITTWIIVLVAELLLILAFVPVLAALILYFLFKGD